MYTAYPAVSVGAWVGPGSRRGGGCPLSLRLRARRQTCCPRRVWHPRMVTDGQSHPWSAAAEGAFVSPTPLTTAVSAWSSASMPPSLRTELPACPRFTGHTDSHRHRGEGGAGRGQKRRTEVVSHHSFSSLAHRTTAGTVGTPPSFSPAADCCSRQEEEEGSYPLGHLPCILPTPRCSGRAGVWATAVSARRCASLPNPRT